MLLNLDNNFNPDSSLPSIDFEAFTFHGGEPHIKITSDLSEITEVTISHRIKSFNDLGLFLIAVDATRRMGVKQINAVLPYFPGARQDRVMVDGEALTVKIYADLVNGCNLEEVKIFDVHSDVAAALLNNCNVVSNHSFINKVIHKLPKDTILISPDGGALKKIYKLAAKLQDYEVIECGKMRDVKTGKLSGFIVHSDDLEGRDVLIVDDICDGGGTFIGLAKELKARNAGKLNIAVSHGIFSKGMNTLADIFDQIFTTDSFSTIENNEVLTQLKLSDGLLK